MTMTLVETITVPVGGATSITFSAIPQTGQTIYVLFSGRQSTSSDGLFMRFNGVSTAIYSYKILRAVGTGAASSIQGSSATFMYIGSTGNSTETANTFANVSITVPNYSIVQMKSASGDSITENNATAVTTSIHAGATTATTAITSLTLLTSGDPFVQYTTASLYTISTTGATGATVA